MLKAIILASAMTFAAPAFAQTAPASPSQNMPQTAPTPAAPTEAAPMDAQTAPAPAQAAPATAEAKPATTPSGVAGVVEQEFASYDKDSNGSLNKPEFGAWVAALMAKTPDSPAAKDPKYADKAFTQADGDKSKSLSKSEVTAFLSGAASAG